MTKRELEIGRLTQDHVISLLPAVKSNPLEQNIAFNNLLNDLYPPDRIRMGDFLKRFHNK